MTKPLEKWTGAQLAQVAALIDPRDACRFVGHEDVPGEAVLAVYRGRRMVNYFFSDRGRIYIVKGDLRNWDSGPHMAPVGDAQ